MKIRRDPMLVFFVKEKLITWRNRIQITSQTILSIITANTAIAIRLSDKKGRRKEAVGTAVTASSTLSPLVSLLGQV